MLKNLNKRELKILELMHQGLKDEEIATRLNKCKGTIKASISKIYYKTGVKDFARGGAMRVNAILLYEKALRGKYELPA